MSKVGAQQERSRHKYSRDIVSAGSHEGMEDRMQGHGAD